jgi:hypothetical protein
VVVVEVGTGVVELVVVAGVVHTEEELAAITVLYVPTEQETHAVAPIPVE